MAGFGISGVEPLGCATSDFGNLAKSLVSCSEMLIILKTFHQKHRLTTSLTSHTFRPYVHRMRCAYLHNMRLEATINLSRYLTPWRAAVTEKLTVAHLVKNSSPRKFTPMSTKSTCIMCKTNPVNLLISNLFKIRFNIILRPRPRCLIPCNLPRHLYSLYFPSLRISHATLRS
jgi:hypothetical protein